MNYHAHYNSLVLKAQNRPIPVGYTEKHHIIPRALGGTDAQSNLVVLTAKEHFVAHLLLAKMYPDSGMIHAIWYMSNIDRYVINSRQFEQIKKLHGERISGRVSAGLSGVPKSDAHKKAWKESRKNGAGWVVSEQRKIDLSAQMTGSGNHMWGVTHTPTARQIIRDANKQKITCPYCNKEGGIAIMKRWHFENCKSAPEPKERKQYPILKCPHCDKNGGGAQMIANHFENCKKRLT